jgi:hypothetical protein
LLADKFGVCRWLISTLPCPDASSNLRAHCIWETMDLSLHTFIIQHIASLEFDKVKGLITFYAIFEHLHRCYEKLELYAQLMYLKKGLDIIFKPNAPFAPTLNIHPLFSVKHWGDQP